MNVRDTILFVLAALLVALLLVQVAKLTIDMAVPEAGLGLTEMVRR